MATPNRPGYSSNMSGQGAFGIVMSTGPSPKKKVKTEDVPAASEEIGNIRKLVLDEKFSQMLELKESYFDHLTECFFLQNGGGLMDYYGWRKRPTPQLVHFLKSGRLDSDDEDENPVIYLKEGKNADEVKMSGAPGSASATSLGTEDLGLLPGIKFGPLYEIQHEVSFISPATVNEPTKLIASTSSRSSSLSVSQGLHRSVSDSRLQSITSSSPMTGSVKKMSIGSPGTNKQASYDGTMIKGISTQEAIVERAKQEAQVMSRVAELRKDGMWSSRRLPKVQEPPRPKAHWDYLLEEMQWLAADFQQERKWKKTCARKIAKMVQKYFQDLEQKELRAEKEEGMKLKKIASNLAKMVKEFWTNIEKVVQYKQNSRLDEKRKKAMDLHLNFIVNQTEQYSNWLSEGLTNQSSKGSSVGSTTPDHSVAEDDEFKPDVESESDDEETIEKDEEGIDETETQDEVAALQKESELPIEQLIENLPKEILEKPAPIHSDSEDQEESAIKKDKDEEFEADDDDSDIEETIEEQEEQEADDHNEEIDDLKNEGEMDIEELRAKYAGAYDADFEMPKDSDEESTDINDSEESEDDDEEDEEEESEEEEEDETMETEADNDVGLEALMDTDKVQDKKEDEEGPGQELTDIAAQAASLQPKGYTLQTTEVKTGVPFLIKHTLREYQHVGLDWLATMYEKRLNGILADEMGLGKTIQTIALIAHLACEKGIWGPHLIVVPTSVMLNWEMEFKKWCPAFKILTYYGSQKERKQKRTGWTKTNAFHICITSYKLVIQDHNAFRRKKWKYLILDEAQNIKNFKSQRWQCLLNFNSMRRLLLTGTPLQNSLMELWSLMHFLMPHVFQSHKDFKEWFANPLTGMIEGSHEYNENLIRRLHKVLRPFLLRRLKDDVEKQMPKKYEHVVMCHLSKRQRFLYDEFMAQGKTKETLATGHFMSVINILMQLRKVCNHPSLFDPRPIVSPFQMKGIVYHTASLVLKVLEYDPLNDIDLQMYPGLAEMERDLPAFIAHRVRKLQTPRRLIEEIEIQPSPPPRPQPGKLKTNTIRCVSPAIQSGRASPALNSRSVSPAPVIKSVSTTTTLSGSSQPPLQATVAPQISAHSTSSSQQPANSQPITVQIQHTDQGTRLVLPSNQLSHLPGFLQIVQTSSGPQTVATSSVVSTSSVLNGSPVVTMASSNLKTLVSSSVSQLKMSPGIQSGTTSSAVHLPVGSTGQTPKPVMRVSPITEGQQNRTNGDGLVFSAASTNVSTSFVMSSSKPVASVYSPQMVKHLEEQKKKQCKKRFFLEPLFNKQMCRKKEKLHNIAKINKLHCERKPVYGQDLCDAVNIFKDPFSSRSYRNRDTSKWNGPGHIHCQCSKLCTNSSHPKYLWNQTTVLSDIIHTPEQYLKELQDILERFVFVTPPVQSEMIRMHVSHPPPSYTLENSYREMLLRSELSPKTANYHKILTKMTVQFPELRLIQYDCGKLQTLDILLHRLKSGDHRVLIFTQMTRMLDILEAFLNYHGHRYLRLDGTTKIEQRQQLMDRFNADRRIFVFILSTRSGGIGVNLTGADTVIFYDSDWNPTMDAQAQDRCHRIGQTRDVHIYRLVSQKTVEENILKKANQKRMLGDMAIEGGNFTTAFFKENTISELFSEPSGLESLVKEKELEEKEKLLKAEKKKKAELKKSDPSEAQALAQFEKALAKTEDETDAVAIDQVKAEQKAELAEFDENIPLEDGADGQTREDESHVEQELAMLDKELTPIERYAVQYTEQMMEPVNEEELKIAEDDIENVKKDWELNRLKALKEEEERRAEMEEDEMLYTYSRDDAYQQVKKRNKQLALEARKSAAEARVQSLSLSPRRAGRQSLGAGDEFDESPSKKDWVYKTPKIIRDLVKNKNVDTESSKKKYKGRTGENDTNEDVDVETVDFVEESNSSSTSAGKQKVKKRLVKSEKSPVKRTKKVKGENLVNVPKSSVVQQQVATTEATRLDSLPGYSVREGIFQKLQQSPPKSIADRANIFEQFGVQTPQPQVPGFNVVQTPGQNQVFQNPMAGQTVRLVNTPQGRQMVVVSSSPTVLQQTSPQNVVLLQGMQGFPQGIVVGNNIVSLQGTPLQMTPVGRGVSPINLQSPRIVGPSQVIQPTRLATRIVSPMGGQNQAFVQRIVGSPQVNTGMIPVSVPVPQLSPQTSHMQQLGTIPQFRLQTPLVHTAGGQMVNIQTTTAAPQRKSSVQTIANLIAAGKMAKQNVQHSKPPPVQQQAALRPPFSVPNLNNLMKAQVPHSIPSATQSSQVRVNPTVAKLVASHIHSSNASTTIPSSVVQSPAVTSVRAASPAIINLSSVSRSQSPTVVKVVSVSRTRSPSPKPGPQVQPGKIPVAQPAPVRGENPVATINIKGLPPGVSIPASLVNSLVSGSIGGISKGGLIRGRGPAGSNQPTTTKTVIRKSVSELADNVNNNQNLVKPNISGTTNGGLGPNVQTVPSLRVDSPDYRAMAGMKPNPDSASASPSAAAWSNPNLVIRTRRAAVQQQLPLSRSPQIRPSPSVPCPVETPNVLVNTNGPQVNLNLPNHINQMSAGLVAKKLEKTNDQNPTEPKTNGGIDCIEIG